MSEASFLRAATVPRDAGHQTGTLDEANALLAATTPSLSIAAVVGDVAAVRAYLAEDPALATKPGGPYLWDPLTYLCFSRYLRLEPSRPFVATARLLLDAGANPNTGWHETIDHPPRQILEAAIYGAAAVAQHFELTRLLLEHGADPNDEETPYHVPESRDNAVLQVLLDSGKLTPESLGTILVRKADMHDQAGMRLALEHGADPNPLTRWGRAALHQAVLRDNDLTTIELLLDHGADPAVADMQNLNAAQRAARRGRGDVLRLFTRRGVMPALSGQDETLAHCALGEPADTPLPPGIATHALAEFAGNDNAVGIRALLALGVSVDTLYPGDGYFEIAPNSTALHVAAWRAAHRAVETLIAAGADVNAHDGRRRTPLQLAVRAATKSYWMARRQPDSIRTLLAAGASTAGIALPSGYPEADELLTHRPASLR